jgi:Sap, sulfolipid-1-addressing protein
VDDVLLFALLAALNPTLVAASTLMMLLPRPVKLMLGYLLGALMTSITLGLIIVFSFEGSATVTTTKRTLSPAATIALGAIALIAATVVRTGESRHGREHPSRHKQAKQDKGPPRWQRALSRGSPRITFLVGALLTLPGASYLAGLSRIDKLNYATAPTVALVVVFNLVMMALLEVPLVLFLVAPEWTPRAVERAKTWVTGHARRFGLTFLTVVGTLLVIKGVVELVA